MKKNVALLLAVFILLLCSCEDKNRKAILEYDRYASYEPVYYVYDAYIPFKNNFDSIESYYRAWRKDDCAIIRVKVYDEIVEHPPYTDALGQDVAHILAKAVVLEIYYAGKWVEDSYLRVNESIWIEQLIDIDDENKTVFLGNECNSLMIPGCEYILYAFINSSCGYSGIYLGGGVFEAIQLGVIPLTITPQEYGQVLENNGFVYVEHDDICEKAIEKYINGNK